MSLHTLRLLTCCTFGLLIAPAIGWADGPTNTAENSPWKTPSEDADSAVKAWANQALASAPQQKSSAATAVPNPPVAPNPFAAGTRYEQANAQQAGTQEEAQQAEVVRYDPNASSASVNATLVAPANLNPLRSGSRQSLTSVREPAPQSAAEQAFTSPQQRELPRLDRSVNEAARVAFDQPINEPLVNLQSTAPRPVSEGLQQSAQPIVTIPLEQVAAEPQPFAPEANVNQVTPLEQIAPVEPPASDYYQRGDERSVLASRQAIGRQAPPVLQLKSTVEPTFSSPRAMESGLSEPNAIAMGTGEPGDVRLEGPQTPSLKIEKRGPAEARVGQPCRFTVTVRNTGSQTAQNVVLRDEIPAGARLIETIPMADEQAGQVVWHLGALAPGEQRSVELRVSPERQGSLGSVATVSFDTSVSAKTVCTQPEIAVRLTAPAKVRVGQKQPLKIEIHNPGTGVATNVVIVEEVPSNLRHEAGPSLEFEVGSIAPGETRQLNLMLTAEQAGSVTNRLTATADGGLKVEQTVAFDVVAPALALSLEGPKRRYLDRPASYTVSIDNPGSAPAKDVRITTHLPSGLKFVRANNMGEYDAETHSVYWSLAELPEGERGEVKLVALPITAGEHTLRVEGEANDGLKTSDVKELVVEGLVSLAFDVRDRQDPIEVGSDAVYDVVVTNEGTKPATNVRVTLECPAGMQIVDAQGKVEHRISQNQVEFAPLPTLRPGEKFPYRIRLRGNQAGDQRITVSVHSDDLDQPIRREESTRVFGDE